MTVFENVLVGASAGGRRRRRDAYRAVVEVLELCELDRLANRRAGALGLLHRNGSSSRARSPPSPAVLLLDEIGAGLTDEEAGELVTTIREVRRGGLAIVWIEHIVHVLVAGRRAARLHGRRARHRRRRPDAVMKDAAVIDAYLGQARSVRVTRCFR